MLTMDVYYTNPHGETTKVYSEQVPYDQEMVKGCMWSRGTQWTVVMRDGPGIYRAYVNGQYSHQTTDHVVLGTAAA